MVNKRVQNAVLGCSLRNDRMISVHFQGKPFNIMVMQIYIPTSKAEEAPVEWFYEDLQDLVKLTSKKLLLFIIGDWSAKVGSQETPGVTGKFGLGVRNEGRAKANRILPRDCTGHSKHPLPAKRGLYTWISPDGQHQNPIDYILFATKDGGALYSQQKQDQELTVAQIMNSLLPNSD